MPTPISLSMTPQHQSRRTSHAAAGKRPLTAALVALAGILTGSLGALAAQPAEAAAAAAVVDDAHARQQSPTTNYGTTETLIVRNDVQSFIRLDISGVTTTDLASVELQLSKKNSANRITIAQAAENATGAPTPWTTSTLTWAGKPPVLSGTSSVTVDAPTGSTAVTVDITTLVTEAKNRNANALTLSLTTAGTALTDIFSTRAADSALRPTVEVTYGIAQHMLVDDAGVRSTAPTANYGTTPNLIVGKGGHAYLRLRIGQLKVEELSTVIVNFAKYNTAAEIVAVRASEFASSNGAATTTPWTETGVTWNTRPLDVPGSATASVTAAAGNQALALDLTELVRQAKQEGAKTLTVHLTTTKADDLTIAGTDIHSTRAADQTKAPWVKVSRTTDESPVDYPVTQQLPDYPSNGRTAQDVVHIKSVDGQYLRVDTGTGAIALTAAKDQASRFAIYGYDYTASEYEGTGGGQQTTYAIKDLASGKFLTIQNYADDGDGPYYAKAGSDYVVTATAPEVKWNERFAIKLFAAAGNVTISSPLEGLRDESEAPTTAIKTSADGLRITPGDRNGYRYTFESVAASLLEVQATASGTTAHLSWLPVGGDTNPAHYSLKSHGAPVVITDGVLSVDVPNLSPGMHSFEVRHDNASTVTTSAVTARIFNHPGVSLTTEQLDTMRDRVAEKAEPWYSDYLRMKNTVPNDLASLDFPVVARSGVGRGNPEGSGNMKDYEYSSTAAYFHALQWAVTGDERHANKAREILNAWSSTLNQIDGRDQILGAGLSTLKLINAAEIVRYYDGGYDAYADEDFAAFQRMMLNVVYPVIQDAGVPMIANGNWDGAAIVAVEAIGVVTDNTAVFDEAVRMYKSPYINGSIENYVTDWGQATESARDQAHAQLGLGLMADTSVIADNQDVDLWSIDDNKLARAFNWVAEYNLFEGEGTLRAEPVPNVFGRTDANAFWDEMDEQAILRGQLRPIYESALAHYSTVEGVDVTWLRRAAEAMRPQGFVHFDSLNFDTLTMYNGEPTTTPAPYFQLRTMLTPWYQRAWSDVAKWGDVSKASRTLTEGGTIPADYKTETLESYFAVRDDGTVAVESMQAAAPYFRLVTNDDESYSIQEVTTGRYLGVSAKTAGQDNLITADSHVVGVAQKFQMRSTGLGRSYLVHDGRLVNVGINGSSDAPRDATLTLRLGTQPEGLSTETTPANALLFSYGTAEADKATVTAHDTTLTTADTWNPTDALDSATSTDGTAVADLSAVIVTGTVDTTVPGAYQVTYHVGTATAPVTVTVEEATAPTAQIGEGGGVRNRTEPVKASGTATPGNTGWGVSGATVRVEVRGADGAVKATGDAAVSEERWSTIVDVASLPAGDYTLAAIAQSRAKGTAEATTSLALRVAGPAQAKPGTPQLSSDNWDVDGTYRLTMDMWWGPNAWDIQWLENGVPVHTEVLTDKSPTAQKATFDVTGKPNGTYVYTVQLNNQHGTTTSAPLTVTVTAANPGVAELSHDNWDGDGTYTVTTNMWWGTNAIEYRLYENGNLVDQKPLTANGRNAQSATTPLTARTPGTYEYIAVLSNPEGETRSKPVTVTVTR